MSGRWQWLVMGVVAIGHAVLAVWLSYAMAPTATVRHDDTVLVIELIDPVDPAPDPLPASIQPQPRIPTPPPRATAAPQRDAVPMQAVIEPSVAQVPDIEAPREFIDAERDPFHRPEPSQAFGRRDRRSLPDSTPPRIAGERPDNALLPEWRMRDNSPQRVAQMIGRFIGGGPDAPVEAPCGGRVNGGDMTADSFSPAWRSQHGCGDLKDRGGYDGTVELPPGTAR